jgi:hypothetical protein
MTAQARLLRPVAAASSVSWSTFGPTALASDWSLGEDSPLLGSSVGATTKVGGDLVVQPEWFAYGMRWTSLTVPKDATINTATLTIRVTTTDASAVAYSAHVEADNTTVPGGYGYAQLDLDICTRTRWSTDIFGGSGGSSGALALDVKAHVEAVTSRSGWSSGNAIAFYLAGGVISDGIGGCIGNASGSDFVQVATDQHGTSSYHPTLEIEYS